MNNHPIDDYINTHPRECLMMLWVGIFLIWQTIACLLGLIVYAILKKYPSPWWLVSLIGLLLGGINVYFSHLTWIHFIELGFSANWQFLKYLSAGHHQAAWHIFNERLFTHTLGLPFLIAGGLSIIDLMPKPAHVETLKALQKGKLDQSGQTLSEKEISSALKKIKDEAVDGVALGVSTETGLPLIIPDYHINQVALVLGTTGAGKTITLRRFYYRAIQQGYLLIIIDGKPDDDNIASLTELAHKHQRSFYGFNCGEHHHYDPLSNGGHTELKDKMISLKDQWENDYYRSIAEDYLQTTFEVLLTTNQALDLKSVVQCLNYTELQNITRTIKSEVLTKRVESLEQYNRADITGLQAHLNILIHSELGQYFERDQHTFTLSQVIADNAVVYFALPALRFPSFSKVLGKLVINDLKAVIDRNINKHKKIFAIFDEFSVFAGEQVLNLVNMGRGKGVHAIFGTQGLADLDKVDVSFKSQVLNCVNTMICHRLNDQDSAETVANWVGTKDAFNITAQLNMKENEASMGSVRVNKEYIVHPDEIKQGLKTGEAFYVMKVGGFRQDKVKIKYS